MYGIGTPRNTALGKEACFHPTRRGTFNFPGSVRLWGSLVRSCRSYLFFWKHGGDGTAVGHEDGLSNPFLSFSQSPAVPHPGQLAALGYFGRGE